MKVFAFAFLLALTAAAQTSPRAADLSNNGAPVPAPASKTIPASDQALVTQCTTDDGLCFLTMSKSTGALAAKLHVLSDPGEVLKAFSDPDLFSPSVASLEILFSEMRELQKQHLALAADYKVLVERFNRLAAINAAPPVVYTAPQPDQRSLILQQWLMMQNSNRPQNVNVNVRDCARFPALCVN